MRHRFVGFARNNHMVFRLNSSNNFKLRFVSLLSDGFVVTMLQQHYLSVPCYHYR